MSNTSNPTCNGKKQAHALAEKENVLNPVSAKMYRDLLQQVKDYVLQHQGIKGYINTQHRLLKKDVMSAYMAEEYSMFGKYDIMGIRVIGDTLSIIAEPSTGPGVLIVCNEDDFENEENWMDLDCGEFLEIETLFSIADSIEEYTK